MAMQHTPSFMNLLDKDLHVKPVSGPLDPLRPGSDRENALPILYHSGVLRKMNGDFDSMATSFTGNYLLI